MVKSHLLQHIILSKGSSTDLNNNQNKQQNKATSDRAKKNKKRLQLGGLGMEPHPVYNTENKNKLPQRSLGKCKSHTASNTAK